MSFCTKCGAKIPDDAKFCNVCGEKLGNSSPETEKTTSTEEKIVAFVENFDVNEKISELKKTAESSEEVAQIKGKISKLKKAAESSEEVAQIKEKFSEVKEAVEANEKVAEIKENLKSNEKVAAFLANLSWKKVLCAVVIIFAALKIFGSDDSLGITPEEFKERYNKNLQVMLKDRSTAVQITDITTKKYDDGSFAFQFINEGVPIMAFTGKNENIEILSIGANLRNITSSDGLLTAMSVVAYSAANKGVASQDDIIKTKGMLEKLIEDALKNASFDAADSEVIKDGISYSFLATGNRKDVLTLLTIQTTECKSRRKKENAEGGN